MGVFRTIKRILNYKKILKIFTRVRAMAAAAYLNHHLQMYFLRSMIGAGFLIILTTIGINVNVETAFSRITQAFKALPIFYPKVVMVIDASARRRQEIRCADWRSHATEISSIAFPNGTSETRFRCGDTVFFIRESYLPNSVTYRGGDS